MKINTEEIEESIYHPIVIAMFCGFVISDIVRRDVSIRTIRTCQRIAYLYENKENLLPDFIHALANWQTKIENNEQDFIYQTLMPLVDSYINDNYFSILLKKEYNDISIPSTKE